MGWRSEDVDGLVSFPVVHGALSLDVPVLVIYGQEGEKRTSGTRGKGPQRRTSSHPSGLLSRLGHGDLTNEAQTLISKPGVSGPPTQDRHQGHAGYTASYFYLVVDMFGGHRQVARLKWSTGRESAERRLTEARVPRPGGSNRTDRVGSSLKDRTQGPVSRSNHCGDKCSGGGTGVEGGGCNGG